MNRYKDINNRYHKLNSMKKIHFTKDQNGVVWCPFGFLDRKAYEELRIYSIKNKKIHPLDMPPYDELPLWDSHQQNGVDVDF